MATSLSPALNLEQLINPTERQREFLAAIAEYDFVLYGGEGGGGKSYILRWWLVLFLVWAYKVLGLRNVRVALFSVDYPTLKDRQVVKMQVEFPRSLGQLKKNETWDFVLNEELGGGQLCLRNLDDPSKYKSAEFAAIAVEELTENPLQVFNDLRWRLRWPGIERPKFAAGTNPGGVGHSWVKRYWIDSKFPAEFYEPEDITTQFKLVRAKASDNPHLFKSYHTRLLSLPPDMAKMVAKGDWNIYTGQYFPNFDIERHVISDKEAQKRLKPWHRKWLSGDWGFEHPACYHWHDKDEQNRVITYRELWDRRVGETEWGRRITAASAGEKLESFPFSWDGGRLSPRSMPKYPKSIVQLLTDSLGDGVPDPHPGDSNPGSRMSGYRLMSQLLDTDCQGVPMWQIAESCVKLIECLPTLIRDEDDPETVLKVDYREGDSIGDDPADSARMGLQHEFGTTVIPVSVVAERKVAQYAADKGKEVEDMDINSVAQLHRRATIQEQRRRGARRGGLGRIWRPGVN